MTFPRLEAHRRAARGQRDSGGRGRLLWGDVTMSTLDADDLVAITALFASYGIATEKLLTAASLTMAAGTVISGAYTDTASANGTSLVTAPENPAPNPDEGWGLEVRLDFTTTPGKVASQVHIKGYFAGAAGNGVSVLAWRWDTGAYELLSNDTTRMNTTTKAWNYTYPLLPRNQDSATNNVRIKFRAVTVDTADRLTLDYVAIRTAYAGASVNDIASAVVAAGLAGGLAKEATLGTPAGGSIAADIAALGGAAGPGASAVTLTVHDADSNPVADAEVWISTDADGTTVVAGTLRTGDDGATVTPFMLTAGATYYAWRRKAGVNFTNPATFVAVAD